MKIEPKPLFVERINKLLNGNSEDVDKFFEMAKTVSKKSIRCNVVKISPEELVKRLRAEYGWEINQPFSDYPEIMIIESSLLPGEIGKTKEHLLGYYYVQEITSMMPVLTLDVAEGDLVLDLCAAPGSKTTMISAVMKNKGSVIANDVNIGRISILGANLERMNATNVIVTRHNGVELCQKLKKMNMRFDKVLVDAPCSGEGNLRTSPRTLIEWSEKLLEIFGRKQRNILRAALDIVKPGGDIVYSTCSYAPEENEEVVDSVLSGRDDFEIVDVELPLKSREGILSWKGKEFSGSLKKARRFYHHDNDMEGFFVCKMRRKG